MYWKLPTIILVVVLVTTPIVNADFLDWLKDVFGAPTSTTLMGSEYLTYNGINYTHIWNNGTIAQHYYYSGDCNDKLSNELGELWERVTIGMSYGENKTELVKNYAELHVGNCGILNSSTADKINFTAWKDVTYLGKSGRLAKQSYMEVNDDYMKETFMFQANEEINTDVWFVVGRTELDVSNNSNDNYLMYNDKVDGVQIINLSYTEANNITQYKNKTQIYDGIIIKDYDTDESISYFPDTNTSYWYIVNGSELLLMYNAGTFTEDEIKTLPTYWVDALCTCAGTINNCGILETYEDGTDKDIGGTFRLNVSYYVNGGGFCSGCAITWQDNYDGSYNEIPASDTDLDCTGVSCVNRDSSDGIWYSRTLTCEGLSDGYTKAITESITACGGVLQTTQKYGTCGGVCTNNYTTGDFSVSAGTEVNCTAENFTITDQLLVSGTLNFYNQTNCTLQTDEANLIYSNLGGVVMIYNDSKLV